MVATQGTPRNASPPQAALASSTLPAARASHLLRPLAHSDAATSACVVFATQSLSGSGGAQAA
jgi:hypothetical protein